MSSGDSAERNGSVRKSSRRRKGHGGSAGQDLSVELALEAHILRYLQENGHTEAYNACKKTFSALAFDRSIRLAFRLEDIINKQFLRVSVSPSRNKPLNVHAPKPLQSFTQEKLYDPPAPVSSDNQEFLANWRQTNDMKSSRRSVSRYAFASTQSSEQAKIMEDSDLSDPSTSEE